MERLPVVEPVEGASVLGDVEEIAAPENEDKTQNQGMA